MMDPRIVCMSVSLAERLGLPVIPFDAHGKPQPNPDGPGLLILGTGSERKWFHWPLGRRLLEEL